MNSVRVMSWGILPAAGVLMAVAAGAKSAETNAPAPQAAAQPAEPATPAPPVLRFALLAARAPAPVVQPEVHEKSGWLARLFGRKPAETPAVVPEPPPPDTLYPTGFQKTLTQLTEGDTNRVWASGTFPSDGSPALVCMNTLTRVPPGGQPGHLVSLSYGLVLRAQMAPASNGANRVQCSLEISHPVAIGRGYDLKRYVFDARTECRTNETYAVPVPRELVQRALASGDKYLHEMAPLRALATAQSESPETLPVLLLSPGAPD